MARSLKAYLTRRRVLAAFGLVLGFVVGPPLGHLGCVAWREARAPEIANTDSPRDFGRTDSMDAIEVFRVSGTRAEGEATIRDALHAAGRENLSVSIAGASHSSGGQTMLPRGIYLDLSRFSCIDYDPSSELITVCGGSRWYEVVQELHQHGRAVKVMQSNSDFSVGGTISVNAHGWQNGSPPVGSTVRSMRVMLANGEVVTASREENTELFRHVIGGYGLFGVIVSATLETVDNTVYRSELTQTDTAGILRTWEQAEESGAELMYGRLSMARDDFLTEALVTAYYPAPEQASTEPIEPRRGGYVERLVFRGSIDSDYGKRLRWDLERAFGGESGGQHARSWIQLESSEWFTNRDATKVDVLHEYFVPKAKLEDFLQILRQRMPTYQSEAINMTVRAVSADEDSVLAYAREDVFAIVMYFHEELSEEGNRRQMALARGLVEAALEVGGTYYLPYRRHPTLGQFSRAYPNAADAAAAKLRFDPELRFQSYFWRDYLGRLVTPEH